MLSLLFITFLSVLVAHSSVLSTSVFTSLENSSSTIDLKTAKLTKALFIAHDCKSCHRLLLKIKRNCESLEVTTFAVGNKKNLKSKLRLLKKLKSNIYIGSTTEAFSDIGIDLIPYYISSKGEKHESGVYAAMMKDGACKKEKHQNQKAGKK